MITFGREFDPDKKFTMFAALMHERKQSEELGLPPSCTIEELAKTQPAYTPSASSLSGASGASGAATGPSGASAPISQLLINQPGYTQQISQKTN